VLPFAALLSDRCGRRVVMASAIVVYVIVNLSLAAHLVSQPSRSAMWAVQGSGLLTVFISGPFVALAVDSFPVNLRATGASIVYNFGVIIFGGLSPLTTDWLVKATHDKLAPFYYLGVCLLLSLIGLAILPRRDPAAARQGTAALPPR
jgi:MHS family proline/betaine transporter-like MFS transporter